MAERNQTLDALRAIAALWVCLFHFTAATGVGAYGYLGVTIFFVISGYIVPYCSRCSVPMRREAGNQAGGDDPLSGLTAIV